ncbi:MAG: hypothetical protein KGY60_09775 [Bacteroidales bacterium]|nr:hypothetical protein [Bacteroidales bacterium]
MGELGDKNTSNHVIEEFEQVKVARTVKVSMVSETGKVSSGIGLKQTANIQNGNLIQMAYETLIQ